MKEHIRPAILEVETLLMCWHPKHWNRCGLVLVVKYEEAVFSIVNRDRQEVSLSRV